MPNNDDTTRQKRQQSASTMAYQAEHRAMLPFRKRIGQIQSRAAFIIGQAGASTAPGHDAIEKDIAAVRVAAAELLADIERRAPGSTLGPAANCRTALQVMLDRLDQIAR